MPFYDPLPISTYTLSLKMAEETGFWDPMVISEDWHVMLNVMFKRHGDVSLSPVFLPTWADATDGETFWRAMKNRYDQVLRHAWGAEDVGYILREIIDEGTRPAAQSVFRLVQVLHDHTLRVASWFMLITGYAINLGADRAWAYYDAGGAIRDVHPVLRYFFLAGTLAVATTIVVELLRYPPPRGWSFGRLAFEIGLMWMGAPVVGFFLGTLPALHAQTKLMFGVPLSWKVTPKRLVERLTEAA